ncbi:MAG: hypothetical protein HQ485_11075 [Acidobacteria bacterium]|nr:hypothetical protein [Acidobacteriota bacterium]
MSIDRMFSWFPNTWRARYEAEVRELLESHPFGWHERRDLLRCCVEAWVREGGSWGMALLRFASALGVRIGAVLGAGWLCLQVVELAVPFVGIGVWPGPWRDAAMSARDVFVLLKMLSFLGLLLYVVAPYTRSGLTRDRPSVGTTLAALVGLGVLQLLDGRHPHPGDLIFFGMIATMRYAKWLEFMRPAPTHVRPSVLGLR